ncbi:MAG: hypothetical protein KDG58_12240 [Anaerolineae bacterium]|nr:hypothetical protein [Anaerolineae bacterium]MCB0234963.1 hypothetical protein [Anaerolineae bacterium]
MRKLIQSVVIASMLILLIVVPAAAQPPDPVDIWPYPNPDPASGGVWTVPENYPVRLIWAWAAKTKGLVRVFQNASSHSYQIIDTDTGDVVYEVLPGAGDSLWGAPVLVDPADWGWDCHGGRVWFTWWEFTFPDGLPEGNYALEITETFSHPVNDGYHTCSDLVTGQQLAGPPSLYPAGTSTWGVSVESVAAP